MLNYELYVKHNNHKILLDASKLSVTHVYGEQLTEAQNDQFTLTFNMPRFIDFKGETRQYNYWLDVVKMGAKLELVLDSFRIIDLVVTSVSPSLNEQNIVYNYSAQDEISYLWAKHNLGYFYPYTDEEDDGPQNIITYATRILRDNALNSKWVIGALKKHRQSALTETFSFSISDSNPYNALVECCNVLGFNFSVDYHNHHINFFKPDNNNFSGYRYRPQTNLKQLSVSYDASNLCTMLLVTGGEDAYGQNISLTPAIPYAMQTWLMQNKDKWDTEATWKTLGNTPYTTILTQIANAETGCSIDTTAWIVTAAQQVVGDQTPYVYFIGSTSKNEKKRIEQVQSELDECLTFVRIADKVPYLGQFLYDFSFFDSDHSGLLSNDKLNAIEKILGEMRINNTYLKIYNPKYYKMLWAITKINAELEVYAEQYEAECRLINDKAQEKEKDFTWDLVKENLTKLSEIADLITKLFSINYFDMFSTVYGKAENAARESTDTYFPYNFAEQDVDWYNWYIYPEWKTWFKNLDAAEQQYETHNDKLDALNAKTKHDIEAEKIIWESEVAAEKESITTYATLKASWEIGYGDNIMVVPGKWSLLIGLLYKAIQDSGWVSTQIGLKSSITFYENRNKYLMRQLYVGYGDYIYESEYSNTDELDSVGLYNQAWQNFLCYNKPSASYNLTTLDLAQLEQIAIPDVRVGNKIRVYNEWLNLLDGQTNNLQYTDNELTITQISRNLRTADVTLTVEKSNKINTILKRLLITAK